MSNPTVHRIQNEVGIPDLVERLIALPSSDLQSLMLEIYRREGEGISPQQLMRSYETNRFVRPSELDPVIITLVQQQLLQLAVDSGFSALELSPLAPFGNCAAIGLVNQNKVVSASRGTEVVADATNLMALEAVHRRKVAGFDPHDVHLCAIHRHVRAQALQGKGFTAHFKVFCAVSGGRDTGSFGFERSALERHIQFYQRFFSPDPEIEKIKFVIKGLDTDEGKKMSQQIYTHLTQKLSAPIEHEIVKAEDHQYYQGTRLSIYITHRGRDFNIGDGGFVDWSQKLSSNSKERMFTSAIGIELLMKLRSGML